VTERSEGTVDPVQLGRAIAAARSERGIKRAELAVSAEVSYPYLSELENGTKHGSTRKIGQIAEALGLTSSQLLARAEALARGVDTSSALPGPAGGLDTGDAVQAQVDAARSADTSTPGVMSLRPLSSLSERTEDLVVERVTRVVRAEIERWLDAELELAVREQVRGVLGVGGETR